MVQVSKHVMAKGLFGLSSVNWTGKQDNSGHMPKTENKTLFRMPKFSP